MNKFNLLDKFCINVDQCLQALTRLNEDSGRADPDQQIKNTHLAEHERRQAAGLMRINHSGEVCAQALYLGQGLTARLPKVRGKMVQAAQEEVDHLKWCKRRLKELNSHTSYLNPLWFVGSFMIGATAGLIGDKWSLGFVAETERQVVQHLESHLIRLPKKDIKSQKILQQMQVDENKHRQVAVQAGAAEFPQFIKASMRFMSKIMTTTTYWI